MLLSLSIIVFVIAPNLLDFLVNILGFINQY